MHRRSIPTIDVYSAGGGQGTTTVAGAIAHVLGCSVEAMHPDFELMWGSAMLARGRSGPLIRDVGEITIPPQEKDNRVAVIRGPSVSGAVQLARVIGRSDTVVLIHEPWRWITVDDLERAIRHEVDVVIPDSRRVARLADSGQLRLALPSLTEFDALREWVDRSLGSGCSQVVDDFKNPVNVGRTE